MNYKKHIEEIEIALELYFADWMVQEEFDYLPIIGVVPPASINDINYILGRTGNDYNKLILMVAEQIGYRIVLEGNKWQIYDW